MLVQCKESKRQLNMVFVEVLTCCSDDAEKEMAKYTKAKDEQFKAVDVRGISKYRIVATTKHVGKIMKKLIEKGYLTAYED